MATQIFTNQTANGSSSQFTTNGSPLLHISGTFDGASIDIQAATNNADDSFGTTGDTPITSAGSWFIPYSPGVSYKLVISSVGAGTDINAFVTT